jgi:hypothetical protein
MFNIGDHRHSFLFFFLPFFCKAAVAKFYWADRAESKSRKVYSPKKEGRGLQQGALRAAQDPRHSYLASGFTENVVGAPPWGMRLAFGLRKCGSQLSATVTNTWLKSTYWVWRIILAQFWRFQSVTDWLCCFGTIAMHHHGARGRARPFTLWSESGRKKKEEEVRVLQSPVRAHTQWPNTFHQAPPLKVSTAAQKHQAEDSVLKTWALAIYFEMKIEWNKGWKNG